MFKHSPTALLVIIFLWSSFPGGTAGGAAWARDKRDAFILNQMVLAQRAATIADEKMWQQMQVVKDELKKLVKAAGGVDSRPERLGSWSESLTRVRDENPYLEEEILKSEFKVNGSDALKNSNIGNSNTSVKVLFDPALTEGQAQRLASHPLEDWRGYPGTINVILGEDGSYFIWAAALDTRPLKTAPGQASIRCLSGNLNVF